MAAPTSGDDWGLWGGCSGSARHRLTVKVCPIFWFVNMLEASEPARAWNPGRQRTLAKPSDLQGHLWAPRDQASWMRVFHLEVNPQTCSPRTRTA